MAERMQIMWQMLKKNYGDQRRYCRLKSRRSRIQRFRKKQNDFMLKMIGWMFGNIVH